MQACRASLLAKPSYASWLLPLRHGLAAPASPGQMRCKLASAISPLCANSQVRHCPGQPHLLFRELRHTRPHPVHKASCPPLLHKERAGLAFHQLPHASIVAILHSSRPAWRLSMGGLRLGYTSAHHCMKQAQKRACCPASKASSSTEGKVEGSGSSLLGPTFSDGAHTWRPAYLAPTCET